MAKKKKKVDVNSAYYLQKMTIDAQKKLSKLSLQGQKDIQKMSDATTAKTLEFNSKEAAIARDWQQEMSNTSHLREVADLKAAGLNPVLSAGGSGGAQSYTTSSASGSAENPSSAVSAMMTGLMSALSSLTNASMNAATGRYQAETSAAAQLKAAQTSAAATKYAADKSYAASVYNANVQYQIAMEKPQSSPFGLIDKYFGGNSSQQKSWKDTISEVFDNPGKYIVGQASNGYASSNKFSLTKKGDSLADKFLKSLGFQNTSLYRKTAFKVLAFGLPSAAFDLQKALKNQKNKKYHGAQK